MTISEYSLKFLGRPYIWGGDGSGKCGGGFDCSGLVVECLRAFGHVDCDCTAQGLHDRLLVKWERVCLLDWKSASSDLLFFGKSESKITHVAIAIGDGLMVEAGGGGAKCKTLETSTGMVRIRPISSRKDIVAVLRMRS